MTTTELSPAILDAFKRTIKHLKGAPATPENKAEGRAIILHFAGRLQLSNLELSQQDAFNILADAYRNIKGA
jgi:hypothetical protein